MLKRMRMGKELRGADVEANEDGEGAGTAAAAQGLPEHASHHVVLEAHAGPFHILPFSLHAFFAEALLSQLYPLGQG